MNIIIPTFNRERLLERSITASLSQSYDNFEVTVVDDGSEDSTEELVKKLQKENRNLNYIKLDKNYGNYIARNRAIEYSLDRDFDALTFHDSDDIPSKDKVELQVKAMETVPDFDTYHEASFGKFDRIHIVCNSFENIALDGSSEIRGSKNSFYKYLLPNSNLRNPDDGFHMNSSLFHRSVFEKVGGFMPIRVSADNEFIARCLNFRFNFDFIEKPLYKRIKQEDSLTVAEETGMGSEYRLKVKKYIGEQIKKYLDQTKKDFFIPLDSEEIEL